MMRPAVFWFCALLAFSLPAFWPGYLSRIAAIKDIQVHVHGVVMFLWVALLITQAWWIRSGQRPTHRAAGKMSFVLAPAVVLSTLWLMHLRLREAAGNPSVELLYFLYVQVSLLAMFALAWGLGIANRHTPAVHARYMVCTAFTLVDPILARLLFFSVGMDFPLGQVLTYGLVDAILLYLIVRDRREGKPALVYPGMLAAFVVTQAPTFFLYKTAAWKSFALWYGALF